MKARLLGVATALALAAILGAALGASANTRTSFPQAKINHVDVSQAPRMKMFVSLLGKGLLPPPPEWVVKASVQVEEKGKKAQPLFFLEDGEATFPEPEDGAEAEPPGEDELPVMTLAEEEEQGMAAVVLVPGIDPDYRDTELGNRVRAGAGLFFKKLGKANRMNIIWYTDELLTYVTDKGRLGELTPLSQTIQAKCRDWQLRQLETYGEPPEESEEEGLAPDEAYCGLTTEYGEMETILQGTAFQGAYPQLFGLEPTYCGKPSVERMSLGKFEGGEDDDEDDEAPEISALDLAFEMLIRDAIPGQPKVILLLGDGRDDYVHRLKECGERYRRSSTCMEKKGKNRDRCVDDLIRKAIAEEQQQFLAKATAWLSLAKAAGIRIYSVVHPNARPHERERLEVLAWRSGGTARVSENANDVVDHYTELIDELNGQIVLSFTDDLAVPGAERRYRVSLAGAEAKIPRTPAYTVTIPKQPEGMAVMIADFRSMGEGKLGKTGFLVAGIAIALVLGLILLKLFGKGLKKILGKGAKGAKGAKKLGKGAAKLGKGAAKLAK